jgi:hypothetical protein
LADATLDVPMRPAGLEDCAQGPHTKFRSGKSGTITEIHAAIVADVDRDGALDLVASVDCSPGEGYFRQLIAFHRGPDGNFRTIGVIVQPSGAGEDNDIALVGSAEVGPNGTITVQVGDPATRFTDGDAHQGLFQSRTYGWNDSAFVQTAGPTSFMVPAGTFDISVDVSPMTYAKAYSGQRLGTLNVTIRNTGLVAVDKITVQLVMRSEELIERASCRIPDGKPQVRCPIGRLEPGDVVTLTFHQPISTSEPRYSINPNADLQVRIGDQKLIDVQPITLVYK